MLHTSHVYLYTALKRFSSDKWTGREKRELGRCEAWGDQETTSGSDTHGHDMTSGLNLSGNWGAGQRRRPWEAVWIFDLVLRGGSARWGGTSHRSLWWAAPLKIFTLNTTLGDTSRGTEEEEEGEMWRLSFFPPVIASSSLSLPRVR